MIRVLQVGPSMAASGGMATVLRNYSAMSLRGVTFDFRASWHPEDAAHGMLRAVRLAGYLLRHSRPDVVHVHLSERGSFLREGAVLMAARWRSIPVVATLHGAELESQSLPWASAAKFVLRRADAIIALGAYIDPTLRAYAIDPTVIHHIPNPQPLGRLERCREATILMGGELGTRKGVDVLIKAWTDVHATHPSARLLLAGPKGDLDLDPGSLKELGIELLGEIEHPALVDQLRRSLAAVLPSRAEVLPMFLLEALANGVHAIATPVGAVPDLQASGGLTLVDLDASDLARVMIEVLDNPDTAVRSGVDAQQWVRSHASPTAVGAALWRVYEQLVR